MDANRFDELTKTWVTTSRRRLLRGWLAAGLAGLGLLPQEGVRATHFDCRHVGVRCRRSRQCCSGICQRAAEGQRKRCQAHDAGICTLETIGSPCGTGPGGPCVCRRTTGGAAHCSAGIACFPCKKDTDTGCFGGNTPGTACLDEPGCPDGGAACSLACPNPST